jgi:hypothetical protein
MLLGNFETAQQAQNAVMASYACVFALAARRQPPQPEIAEHWHGVRSPNRLRAEPQSFNQKQEKRSIPAKYQYASF